MSDRLINEKITATASEDFKSNIVAGIRYVDKTMLLVPLLKREHETTFFLRPRRFGKTLTLSMIRYFVEDTRDQKLNEENHELFQGLRIMEAGEQYTGQMTSYPVVNLTLQSVKDEKFKGAWESLQSLIQDAYGEKLYLLQSDALSEQDRNYFLRIINGVDNGGRKATKADYKMALKKLTEFLRKDSEKRAVVLIDEYDVPLEKAYQNGYYKQMVDVIGPLLQNVLKTNSNNLQFAVVTGCLRIAKEGIYTGLNNPEINTVLSDNLSDVIGFTDEEVQWLLGESGLTSHYQDVRAWYDGYRFGTSVIYNPWSVIKYIENLRANPNAVPKAHWANTSGNAIIRELAEQADAETKNKIEQVMQGEEITFALRDNIVYDEIYSDPDNVLNVMLAAGYLTATDFDGRDIHARIPNKEVYQIYEDQISRWFRASLKQFNVGELYRTLESGDTERIEEILTKQFFSAMSYYDSVEAFYHGVLLAIMRMNNDYTCVSNRESGDGRFDICAKVNVGRGLAIILEVKVSEETVDMISDAKKGAAQIKDKKYFTDLQMEGYRRIVTYGIAFCQKACRVAQGITYEQ